MEWSIDTKSGYDDLEVYMEYEYVFASATGRNHAKMAYCLFNLLRPRPNDRNFADNIFKYIFLNGKFYFLMIFITIFLGV